MVKQFKDIKKYTHAMGFKNQKEFRNHIESKREKRMEYRKEEAKLDTYYSLKPDARSVMRDEKVSNTLNMFAMAVGIWANSIKHSNHASTVHSHRLVLRNKRSGKYWMSYHDISFYRVGGRLILKTFFRGNPQRVEVKLPMNWREFSSHFSIRGIPFAFSPNGLLKNELGYLGYGGILKRFTYDVDSNSFKYVGIAIVLDSPLKPGEKYWEHGLTIKDCIRERENKLETHLYLKKIQDQSEKSKRKQRLVFRLCNRVRITFQDALDSGNCLTGVSNFVKSNFPEKMPVIENNRFVNNRYITLGELKGMGSSSYTQRVVDYVCMMVSQLTV